MRLFFFLIFALGMSQALGQENWQLEADYRFSMDSDEATYRGPLFGIDHLRTNRQYEGIHFGQRRYEEPLVNGHASFDELQFSGRRDLGETVTASGALIMLDGEEWDPLLFNLNLTWQPTPKWRLEGYAEKDLLGTSIAAIDNRIDILVTGLAAEYAFTPQFSVLGNLTRIDFSDGNQRNRQVLMAIWSPGWVEGLSFRLEGRQSQTDFNPAEYFAPDTHDQVFASARLVKALDDQRLWWLLAEGGMGYQKINGLREDAHKYRVSLEGPLTPRLNIKGEYLCTSDGGNYRYEYCAGTAGLSYRW